jgi:S-adenosylmethionine uptake transporter
VREAPLDMVKGILLGFLSYALFSCGDAAVKALGGHLSVFEIGFFSTLFSCTALPFAKQADERWRDIFRMERPGLVLLRGVAGLASILCSVFAFTHLPFAEVYSLIFLAPLLVTILSIPILGETVGWRRGIAIVAGFAGVLLVVRPGFRELAPAHFFGLATAFCGAISMLVLRAIGGTERRITLIAVVFAASLAFNGVFMLFDFQVPAPHDLMLLATSGICGAVANILIIVAIQAAPANRIAPAQYSQIVWAVLLGALFFGEVPDAFAFAGIALVTFAGLFTFAREQKRGVRFPPVWTMVWGKGRDGKAEESA